MTKDDVVRRLAPLLALLLVGQLAGLHRDPDTLTDDVVLDGTMSSLEPGQETNAGLAWKLLKEAADPATTSLRYEGGVQWESWRTTRDIVEGLAAGRIQLQETVHDLRRYAATYASRSGVPIEIVSKVILRHSNLSATQCQ